MLATVRRRQLPDVIILDELEVELHDLFIVLNGDSLVHTMESKRGKCALKLDTPLH